jgi:hypothetical protein
MRIGTSLPPDVQKVFDQVSAEFVGKMGKTWDEIDGSGMEFAGKRGNKVIALSKEEDARWVAAVRPLLDDYIKEVKAKGLPPATKPSSSASATSGGTGSRGRKRPCPERGAGKEAGRGAIPEHLLGGPSSAGGASTDRRAPRPWIDAVSDALATLSRSPRPPIFAASFPPYFSLYPGRRRSRGLRRRQRS